jgi:hypothetical protein
MAPSNFKVLIRPMGSSKRGAKTAKMGEKGELNSSETNHLAIEFQVLPFPAVFRLGHWSITSSSGTGLARFGLVSARAGHALRCTKTVPKV